MSTISFTDNSKGFARLFVSLSSWLESNSKVPHDQAMNGAAIIAWKVYEANAEAYSKRYHESISILDVHGFYAVLRAEHINAKPYADDYQLHHTISFIDYNTDNCIPSDIMQAVNHIQQAIEATDEYKHIDHIMKITTTNSWGYMQPRYFWDLDGNDYHYTGELEKPSRVMMQDGRVVLSNSKCRITYNPNASKHIDYFTGADLDDTHNSGRFYSTTYKSHKKAFSALDSLFSSSTSDFDAMRILSENGIKTNHYYAD